MFDLDTGRRLRTPDGELRERSSVDGRRATALHPDPRHATRPDQRLTPSVEAFLRSPFVVGLAPLVAVEAGSTLWETGPCRWLAELLAEARAAGRPMGARAAVELWSLGSAVLSEAAETGAQVGCFSHLGLSPWRIGVLPGGRLTVFGYGLAMSDVAAWLDGDAALPHPDHLRCCPPERLLDVGEGEAADQWALAAMVAEVATGRPLLEGHDAAALAAALRIADVRDGARAIAPKALRDALDALWVLDPDRRPGCRELRSHVDRLRAADLPGPSLASFVGAAPTAPAEPLTLGLTTQLFDRGDLARAAADEADSAPGAHSADAEMVRPRGLRRLAPKEPSKDAPEVAVAEAATDSGTPLSPRALRRLGR
jgi:hypothetical protein